MGCGGFLLAMIVRGFLVFGYFPKAIWSGVAVGAVAGLIIALVKWDWWQILYGCGWGFLGGLVFELVIRLIDRIDTRRRR